MGLLTKKPKTTAVASLLESPVTPSNRNKYKNLHKWMIIPMVIMQLGIFRDYWGDFMDNAWSVHIHYWTGSVWYLYLILQPYYATHGQMAKHRTNGIIGMFIAGGVCLTALSMMHRDIVTTQRSLANDGGLWLCRAQKHHTQEATGKSCVVVDINRIYHYDARPWPRNSKHLCGHAYQRMAPHRHHLSSLHYRGGHYFNVIVCRMEVPET
jgi:hypothetical protein